MTQNYQQQADIYSKWRGELALDPIPTGEQIRAENWPPERIHAHYVATIRSWHKALNGHAGRSRDLAAAAIAAGAYGLAREHMAAGRDALTDARALIGQEG